jgi:hypothetical protein
VQRIYSLPLSSVEDFNVPNKSVAYHPGKESNRPVLRLHESDVNIL